MAILLPTALAIKSTPKVNSPTFLHAIPRGTSVQSESVLSPPMTVSKIRTEAGLKTLLASKPVSLGKSILSTKGLTVDQPSSALKAKVGSLPSAPSSTGIFKVPSTVPENNKSLGTDNFPLEGSNTTRA